MDFERSLEALVSGGFLQRVGVLHFVFSLLLVGIIWLAHDVVRRAIAFRLAKAQTGCVYAKRYPHTDRAWGSDLIKLKASAMAAGNIMEFYDEQFKKLGGTWVETQRNEEVLNTMDVDNIKHILTTDSDAFIRHPTRLWNSRPLLGTGIFNSNGQRWKDARERLKPAFLRSEIGNMKLIEKHTDRLLALFPQDESTFDAQPLLKKMFLDSITEYLFGKSTDSLVVDDKSAEAEQFLRDLDAALAGMGKRRQAGITAYKYMLDRKWPAAIRKVHAFIDLRVQEALAATSAEDKQDHDRNDEKEKPAWSELRRTVLLYEMAKTIRDPLELRYQILNVFLPGRDTTAVLLSNTLFRLSRSPDLWPELRTYALKRKAGLKDVRPTFENLKDMTPLRNVLYEVLRTTSPAGRSGRWACRDSILPTGGGPDGTQPVFVPKGTAVQIAMYSLHRDPAIWGPDADEFRPQRWEEMSGKVKWEFIPFLGGAGICPANQLVLVQATYVLWRILCEFSGIECRDEVEKHVEMARMLLESRNGAKIALKRAADTS